MNNGFYITATATEQILGETANQLKNQVDDLQQRIDKAIEYIEKSTIQIGIYGELDSLKKEPIYALKNDFKINNVLSILRGEDNE